MHALCLTLVVLLVGLFLLDSAEAQVRVPYPGCYDYHGCGVDEMSDAEYRNIWQQYGFSTPPTQYGHLGDGSRYYVIHGTLYIEEFNGNLTNLEGLGCAAWGAIYPMLGAFGGMGGSIWGAAFGVAIAGKCMQLQAQFEGDEDDSEITEH